MEIVIRRRGGSHERETKLKKEKKNVFLATMRLEMSFSRSEQEQGRQHKWIDDKLVSGWIDVQIVDRGGSQGSVE